VTAPQVCVVGAGGREHAIAEACQAAGSSVVVTPGNPGIPWSTSTPAEAIEADVFIVGPERPLVDGIADRLRSSGKVVFGPGADGAKLEGSKAWMKEVVEAAGVPTAGHGVFTDAAPARAYLDQMGDLFVIKTDGLADGKGVLVTTDRREAVDAVDRYLDGSAFGDAGRTVVIEEGLTGPEVSLLVVTDGTNALALPPAQDHKRLGDGDTGPNTGGMGAFSPVPTVGPDVVQEVMASAVEPTLAELRRRGIDYRGVLYAGIMLTPDGPKLLEYNVRFGDPEAQVVLPRLTSSLPELALQAANGRLVDEPTFTSDSVVGVVLATPGYPEAPVLGSVITGMPSPGERSGIYCSGVAVDGDGQLVTAGGRVMTITGRGATLGVARTVAYELADRVTWPGRQFRRDVGCGH
jgi:phosphoribosylamine--glycine ligase